MTAAAAPELKGLEFEKVAVPMPHNDEMERLYGPGNTTVPGLTIDGEERVHGSVAILERLEQLVPEPPLYPEPIAGAIREAGGGGDGELQAPGPPLPWGALQFRPEAVGTFAEPYQALDPAGTDFAIRFARAMWKYHRISATPLAED